MGTAGHDWHHNVTPRGESYDLDNFGMIVSTTDEESHPDQTSEPRGC